MSWFKIKNRKHRRWKTSFRKENVEIADLHEPILNKIMTTQESCINYNFVAPLE